MTKVSKSPDRNSFQKENYIKRCQKEGVVPNAEYLAMYERWTEMDREWAETNHSNENNLEWDLRTTDWILNKVRSSTTYSQNLYAAMCNNEFMKLDVIPILKGEVWGCSWRHAGGIIADMRQEGDYIDWYCSGIRNDGDPDNGSVPESVVTDEIREDLKRLGWIVVEDKK